MVGSTLLLVAFALLPAVVALQPNAAPRNFGRRQCAARAPTIFLNAAADDSFEGSIAQFAPKRMLPQVRGQRIKIQEQLAGAVAGEDYVLAAQLRDDLAELRQKDPAVMAAQLRDDLARHIKRERYGEAALCRDRLLVLRRFLPQYQLAGLWKGNYPNHGDELVRLAYQGDTLVATKVTGDEHVPAGEVTFRADLTQPTDGSADDDMAAAVGLVSFCSSSSSTNCERAPLSLRNHRFLTRPFPLSACFCACSRPTLLWGCASRCSRSTRTAGMSRGRLSSTRGRGASPRVASATLITSPASSS